MSKQLRVGGKPYWVDVLLPGGVRARFNYAQALVLLKQLEAGLELKTGRKPFRLLPDDMADQPSKFGAQR